MNLRSPRALDLDMSGVRGLAALAALLLVLVLVLTLPSGAGTAAGAEPALQPPGRGALHPAPAPLPLLEGPGQELERPAQGLRLPPERKEREPVPGLDPDFEGTRQQGSHPDGSPSWVAEGGRFGDEWVRHGAWEAFHPGGGRYERGRYWRGVEDGPWAWWYPDGAPMAHGAFVRGRREGPWVTYHEGGRVWTRGEYREGLGEGSWEVLDEAGSLRARGTLAEGRPHGVWRVWSAGRLDEERSGLFERGERIGPAPD